MRWIFRLLGAIVLALVVVVAGLFLLPQDKIARIAADQIRAQTGREVDFGNDVRLSFWPVLGVETGPVTLGNADWAADGPMLTASHLAVGVCSCWTKNVCPPATSVMGKTPTSDDCVAFGRQTSKMRREPPTMPLQNTQRNHEKATWWQ